MGVLRSPLIFKTAGLNDAPSPLEAVVVLIKHGLGW